MGLSHTGIATNRLQPRKSLHEIRPKSVGSVVVSWREQTDEVEGQSVFGPLSPGVRTGYRDSTLSPNSPGGQPTAASKVIVNTLFTSAAFLPGTMVKLCLVQPVAVDLDGTSTLPSTSLPEDSSDAVNFPA